MSFFSGFMFGRMTTNKNGSSDTGEGLGYLFLVGLGLASIHAFGWGLYNVIDAFPRLVAYASGGIDTLSSAYLACVEPSAAWLDSAKEKYSSCFIYTRSFAWFAVVLKAVAVMAWVFLLLKSLAGSRLAFLAFALANTVIFVLVWGICGKNSCAAWFVADLKGWQYWRPNRIEIDGPLYGLLGGAGFLLLMFGLRKGIGRERLGRWSLKRTIPGRQE